MFWSQEPALTAALSQVDRLGHALEQHLLRQALGRLARHAAGSSPGGELGHGQAKPRNPRVDTVEGGRSSVSENRGAKNRKQFPALGYEEHNRCFRHFFQ